MKGKQYWIVLRVQDEQGRLLSKSELYWFKLDNDYFNEASNALHKVTTSYMMLLLFETF